jgi:hypothetical protein
MTKCLNLVGLFLWDLVIYNTLSYIQAPMEVAIITILIPLFGDATELFLSIFTFLGVLQQQKLSCTECFNCKRRFDESEPLLFGTDNNL